MTTTTNNTTTIFSNIYNAIIAEKQHDLDRFTKDLLNEKDVNTILASWYYKDLLPASKKKAVWEIKTLIPYLIDRKTAQIEKAIAKELLHLQTVEQAADLESITVSVEWKKSRMWGSNPTADARVCDKDYGHNYSSGSVGGCGYDKCSTAVANAVNQSNSFLKAMYLVKEQNVSKKNHELFGYGSGYGILPRLEGGVGVSCYPRIFETIGFTFNTTASGKSFDVYTVTKK